MSEFPGQFRFEEILSWSMVRLQVFATEALRQRASKANVLAGMLLAPHRDKDYQKELDKGVTAMLNPYRVTKEVNKAAVDTGWAILRARRK